MCQARLSYTAKARIDKVLKGFINSGFCRILGGLILILYEIA